MQIDKRKTLADSGMLALCRGLDLTLNNHDVNGRHWYAVKHRCSMDAANPIARRQTRLATVVRSRKPCDSPVLSPNRKPARGRLKAINRTDSLTFARLISGGKSNLISPIVYVVCQSDDWKHGITRILYFVVSRRRSLRGSSSPKTGLIKVEFRRRWRRLKAAEF